ncbi:MAG: fibronectin type III domain-containing protein [Bdellovibrionales bacterium]|nr:fibronectin type III domain-containing protein [Bdellovibrionales bacterium]
MSSFFSELETLSLAPCLSTRREATDSQQIFLTTLFFAIIIFLMGCDNTIKGTMGKSDAEVGGVHSKLIMYSGSSLTLSLAEGDSYSISVSFNRRSAKDLSVDWTVGGSGQFTTHQGSVLISPNSSGFEINLSTIDDSVSEGTKYYSMFILGPPFEFQNSILLLVELIDDDTSPPPNPASPSVIIDSTSSMTLSWVSGGGTTVDYRIAYQPGGTAPVNCNSGTVVSESSISGTSHQVTGLAPSTQYSFRICSVNGNDTPDVSSGVTVSGVTNTPADTTGPGAVIWSFKPDKLNSLATEKVFLSWSGQGIDAESGVRDYRVEQFSNGNCSGSPASTVAQAEASGWYNLSMGANSIRVTAYDKANNLGTPDCSGGLNLVAAGPMVTGFGTNGVKFFDTSYGSSGFVDSLALSNDQIVVCGNFYVGSRSRPLLGKLNTDGSWDTSFGENGTGYRGLLLPLNQGSESVCEKIDLQTDGKIIQGGWDEGQGLGFVARYSSSGVLDGTFGDGGLKILQLGSTRTRIQAVRVLSSGKIAAAGIINDGANDDAVVLMLKANGEFDTTFNGTGFMSFDNSGLETRALAVAEGPNDSILVAGETNSSNQIFVARINSAGSLDSGFGSGGITVSDPSGGGDQLYDLKVLGDGRLLAAGTSSWCGLLVRYDQNGALDATYGTGGFASECSASEVFYRVFPVSGGKALAIGSDSLFVARFLSDGSLDIGFGNSGINELWSPNSNARGLSGVILSTGEIFVVGYGWVNRLDGETLVGVYNSDGTVLGSFGVSGLRSYMNFGKAQETLSSLKVMPITDKIVLGFSVEDSSNGFNYGLLRTDLNGVLDATFASGGKGIFDVSNGAGDNFDQLMNMFLHADGTLTAAGIGWQNGSDMSVARWTPAGIFDITLNGTGQKNLNQAGGQNSFGMTVQSDGKTILTGYSGSDVRVARLNTDGSFDTSFNGTGYATTNFGSTTWEGGYAVAVQTDGMVVTVGAKDEDAGVIARYTTGGVLDTGFNTTGKITVDRGGREFLTDLSIQVDGKILTFGIEGANFVLSRYNTDGSVDTSFGGSLGYTRITLPGGPTECDSARMLVLSDGSIILTGSVRYSGVYRDIVVARLTASGVLHSSFNGGAGILVLNLGGHDDSAVEAGEMSDGSVVVGFRTNRDIQYDIGVLKISPNL